MLIIPAIDLKDGECVRLRQGRMEDSTVFSTDPLAMARQWVEAGCRRLHLVDLNGAFAGEPVNRDIIQGIAAQHKDMPIQIGGGIRSADTIEMYLSAGVRFAILGTIAVKDPDLTRDLCEQFKGHIIIGLDATNGMVATEGWAEASDRSVIDLAREFEAAGVAAIVYTDIERDGMMQGLSLESTAALAEAISIPVIASGGVTTLEDVQQLQTHAYKGILGAITGRAIYEGTLDLAEAQAWCDENA